MEAIIGARYQYLDKQYEGVVTKITDTSIIYLDVYLDGKKCYDDWVYSPKNFKQFWKPLSLPIIKSHLPSWW
jgi:hypothetical protein